MMARNQYSHNQSGFTAFTVRMHALYLCVWWALLNMALVHTSPLVEYKPGSGNQLLLKANDNMDNGDLTGVHTSTVEYAHIPNELESRRRDSLYQGAQQSLQTLTGADQVSDEHNSNSVADSSAETALEAFQHVPMHKSLNWAHDQSLLREKRSDDSVLEKRKWSNRMSAWGKRAPPSVDDRDWNPDIDDKKWSSSFNAWGKRDSDNYAKKWASMSAWGKRWAIPEDDWDRYGDEDTANKRWSKSMNAWGKRNGEGMDEYTLGKRWSNTMSAWGKRSDTEPGSNGKLDGWRDDVVEDDKRWAKGMNAWGKRADDSYTEYDKKWANVMNAWGKRDDDIKGSTDIDKRWAKTMSAWGKRDPSGNEVLEDDKRWAKAMNAWGKRNTDKKWSSTMNAWGKRDSFGQDLSDKEKRWSNVMDSWGKRWSHAMNAWGKRSTKKWSGAMNAWGKRQSDDTMDKTRIKRWSSSMNSVSNQNPTDFAKSYQTLKYIEDSLGNVGHGNQAMLSGSGARSSNSRQYSDLSNGSVPSKRDWMPSSHYWIKRTNFPYYGGPKRGWRGHDLNVWG